MHDWPNIYHHIICIISYFTIYKVKFSLTFPWASQKLLSAAKEHWHNFCIWRHNNCTVIVIVCRYFYKNWEGAAHCIYDLVQSCSAAVWTRDCSIDTDKLYYRHQLQPTALSGRGCWVFWRFSWPALTGNSAVRGNYLLCPLWLTGSPSQ